MRKPPAAALMTMTLGPTAAAVLALAGCGTAAAPAAARGATAASSACRSSAIQVSLDTSAAGVATGSSYVPLEFRNTSSRSCTLPRYPQVSFASGLTGPAIGSPAVTEPQTPARSLVLAPGHVAHAWLQIQNVAGYTAGTCKPETARGLRIDLAANESASFISRDIAVCAAAPRGSDILAVFPVQAGQAKRGTAP
jgi:hypothetical protein